MPTLHLMLTGNPGVGKTTVARLYGRILKDLNVSPGGQLEEQKLSSPTRKYLGHTQMENHRSSFVVIFATYASKVEAFFDLDPGLRRRVSEIIEFPDYSNTELAEILERMVAKDKRYQLEAGFAVKVARMLDGGDPGIRQCWVGEERTAKVQFPCV